MCLVTALVGLNLFTLIVIFEIKSGHIYIDSAFPEKSLMGIILIINYFIFNRKDRYKKIIKKYTQKDSSLSSILVVFYCIMTFWLFFHYGSEARELRIKP